MKVKDAYLSDVIVLNSNVVINDKNCAVKFRYRPLQKDDKKYFLIFFFFLFV